MWCFTGLYLDHHWSLDDDDDDDDDDNDLSNVC